MSQPTFNSAEQFNRSLDQITNVLTNNQWLDSNLEGRMKDGRVVRFLNWFKSFFCCCSDPYQPIRMDSVAIALQNLSNSCYHTPETDQKMQNIVTYLRGKVSTNQNYQAALQRVLSTLPSFNQQPSTVPTQTLSSPPSNGLTQTSFNPQATGHTQPHPNPPSNGPAQTPPSSPGNYPAQILSNPPSNSPAQTFPSSSSNVPVGGVSTPPTKGPPPPPTWELNNPSIPNNRGATTLDATTLQAARNRLQTRKVDEAESDTKKTREDDKTESDTKKKKTDMFGIDQTDLAGALKKSSRRKTQTPPTTPNNEGVSTPQQDFRHLLRKTSTYSSQPKEQAGKAETKTESSMDTPLTVKSVPKNPPKSDNTTNTAPKSPSGTTPSTAKEPPPIPPRSKALKTPLKRLTSPKGKKNSPPQTGKKQLKKAPASPGKKAGKASPAPKAYSQSTKVPKSPPQPSPKETAKTSSPPAHTNTVPSSPPKSDNTPKTNPQSSPKESAKTSSPPKNMVPKSSPKSDNTPKTVPLPAPEEAAKTSLPPTHTEVPKSPPKGDTTPKTTPQPSPEVAAKTSLPPPPPKLPETPLMPPQHEGKKAAPVPQAEPKNPPTSEKTLSELISDRTNDLTDEKRKEILSSAENVRKTLPASAQLMKDVINNKVQLKKPEERACQKPDTQKEQTPMEMLVKGIGTGVKLKKPEERACQKPDTQKEQTPMEKLAKGIGTGINLKKVNTEAKKAREESQKTDLGLGFFTEKIEDIDETITRLTAKVKSNPELQTRIDALNKTKVEYINQILGLIDKQITQLVEKIESNPELQTRIDALNKTKVEYINQILELIDKQITRLTAKVESNPELQTEIDDLSKNKADYESKLKELQEKTQPTEGQTQNKPVNTQSKLKTEIRMSANQIKAAKRGLPEEVQHLYSKKAYSEVAARDDLELVLQVNTLHLKALALLTEAAKCKTKESLIALTSDADKISQELAKLDGVEAYSTWFTTFSEEALAVATRGHDVFRLTSDLIIPQELRDALTNPNTDADKDAAIQAAKAWSAEQAQSIESLLAGMDSSESSEDESSSESESD